MGRGILAAAVIVLLTGASLVPALGPTLGPGGRPEDAGLGTDVKDGAEHRNVARDLGAMMDGFQGAFVENRGQVADGDVRFHASGDPLSVGLTPTGAVFTLREARPVGPAHPGPVARAGGRSATFSLELVGCRATEPRGIDAPGYTSNFFLGDDPDRWVRGAASFTEVVYGDVYPGIDLRFQLGGGMLKYEFMLDAGADPGCILMAYEGVDGLAVDGASGDLLIHLPVATLRDARPVILQEGVLPLAGAAGDFEVIGGDMVRFVLPPECDRGRPLVIDPGLEFSTLFGGRGQEVTNDVGMDDEGHVYLVGNTESDDLRVTPGAFNTTFHGMEDMFVAKFDPTLATLEFATYIGGYTSSDFSIMLRVASGEGIYVCGYTESSDFPTTPGVIASRSPGGADAVLFLLSLDGSQLLKSTFIGGSDLDSARSIDFDDQGNIYVSGRTQSPDFPTTPGAYDRTYAGGGRGDAYVIKLTKGMDRVLFGTYLGGPGEEYYISLRLGAGGNIYVTGRTQSRFFPTTSGAYCRTFAGDYDGFICKLSPDGSALLNSTFIGGTNREDPYDIQILSNGSIAVVAYTTSPNFPVTSNAICGTKAPSEDMVVFMMDGNLSQLQFSTFLGGNSYNYGYRLALGPDEKTMYVLGLAASDDLPCTVGAYDPVQRGHYDLFIMGIDMRSLSRSYLTYIGGESADYLTNGGIVADADGRLLVAGYTFSQQFPTTSKANRTFNNGSYDSFVLWFDPVAVGAPDAPTDLSAVAGDGYVDISWTVPSNESYRLVGQRLYRGTSPDDISEPVELGTDGGYNDTDVTNGVTYYYQVVTINSAGESQRPPAVNATPLGPPTVPLGLTAASGDGTVALAWERPTYVGGVLGGYHVLRGRSAGALEPIATIGAFESFVDVSVALGTTYFYAVAAFNALFSGPMSKTISIKATGLPSPPRNVTVAAGNHSITVSWAAPLRDGGGVMLGYYVYHGTAEGDLTFLASVPPSMLAFSHTGLENGRTHYYRVIALSTIGESDPSEVSNATPKGPPDVPRAVVASGNDGSVTVSWQTPQSDGGSAITEYRVYAGLSVGSLALRHNNDAATTDFTDAPVTNGETRYYTVSAVNAEGEGARSAIVQATAMGLPSAPKGLAAKVTPTGINLTWGAPDDFGGSPRIVYRIMRGASPGELAPIAEVAGDLMYLDTSVEKGKTYHYQVVPVNSLGKAGAPSGILSQVMLDVPGVPVSVSVRAGDRSVSISWGAPVADGGSPVRAYAVLRGTNASGMEEIAQVRVALYDDRDPMIVNQRTYLYAICAINEVGRGPRSAPVSARPMPPPGKPTALLAKEEDGDVVLTWTAPTGETATVTGYLVYRGTDASDLKVIAELGTVTTFTDAYLEPGRTYHYSVRATSDSGEGALADPAQVKLEKEVGRTSWLLPALMGLVVLFALLAIALMLRGLGGRGKGPGAG